VLSLFTNDAAPILGQDFGGEVGWKAILSGGFGRQSMAA